METPAKKPGFNGKQFIIWMAALIIGAGLGLLGVSWLNDLFNFIASVYTRLFQWIAMPVIALAVMTTLAMLGTKKDTGKIFLHTIIYTLLTTIAAAAVGAILYMIVKPLSVEDNAPAEQQQIVQTTNTQGAANLAKFQPKADDVANVKQFEKKAETVYEHILNIIPNNFVKPLSDGNVLSILLVAAAIGLTIAAGKNSENIQVLLKGILGMQEVLFSIIRALVWALPLGIVAFSAQLFSQIAEQGATGAIGKYVSVVLGGNLIQFFIILPLFLLCRRINPLHVFRCMLPAVLVALFTKSSAATLPVTVESAERNLHAKPEVARFILPMCCTINMNGCAAFILVTSLFVMQSNGVAITFSTILIWVLIAVISAIGNAGVPMGCFFLTLSLMSGINMPIEIMGVILPIYAIIDMIETAENVWSDCCVCAMVDKTMSKTAA